MEKQATSTDVAKRAGVSQSTVSFVLNKRHDKTVSKETRDRVMKAARELRYRSNRLSEGILRGKSGIIGILIPEFQDYYYGTILSGITDEIVKAGATMLLMRTGRTGENESNSVNRLMEYRVEGIICVAYDWGSDKREVWLEEVIAKNIPISIVDDRSHAAIADCIVTDDVRGARAAVSHLIDMGHRRIAHIAGSPVLSTAVDRKTGYINALCAAGIEIDPELIVGNDFTIESAVDGAEKLLNRSDRPTAVFAANDGMVVPLLKLMKQQKLRCPEDIAVVGYSDTILADPLDLTSVSQNPREIGATAVKELLRREADPAAPPLMRTMPTKLVIRGSSNWKLIGA